MIALNINSASFSHFDLPVKINSVHSMHDLGYAIYDNLFDFVYYKTHGLNK